MKKIVIFLMLLFAVACSCAEQSRIVMHTGDGADSLEASAHTVRIVKKERGLSRIVSDGGLVVEPWDDTSAGTGIVIEIKDGHTLVMTARHVAHSKPFTVVEVTNDKDEPLADSYAVIQVTSITFDVSQNDDESCTAREVYENAADDVSLIDVDCILGSPAVFADQLPPYGSSIVVVGNPLDLFSDVFVPMEGLYVGATDTHKIAHLMTNPIVGGYSGAGVWRNGQLVGMAHAINTYANYRQLSYMIPLNSIRNDVAIYRATRLVNLDGG